MRRKPLELELVGLRFKHYTDEVHAAIYKIVRSEHCDDTSDVVIDGLWETCRDDLVAVLQQKGIKAELGDQDDDALISTEAREAVRRYIDQALTYEAELADSEDDYFEKLYRTLMGPIVQAKRDHRRKSAQERDRWDFFNQLEADAVFDQWRDRLLTPAQAVALSFGKDPDVVSPEQLKPYRRVIRSPFRESFKDRLELIEAAAAAGVLPAPMSVNTFAPWARAHGFALSPALTGEAIEEDAAFWKQKYEAAETEIKWLRCNLVELPYKSQSSIYRLVLGMAISKFGYKTIGKTETVSKIIGALERVDIIIKSDATRKHLELAVEHLGVTWPPPKE